MQAFPLSPLNFNQSHEQRNFYTCTKRNKYCEETHQRQKECIGIFNAIIFPETL